MKQALRNLGLPFALAWIIGWPIALGIVFLIGWLFDPSRDVRFLLGMAFGALFPQALWFALMFKWDAIEPRLPRKGR